MFSGTTWRVFRLGYCLLSSTPGYIHPNYPSLVRVNFYPLFSMSLQKVPTVAYKSFAVLFTLIMLLGVSAPVALAFIPDPETGELNVKEKPSTWMQSVPQYNSIPLGWEGGSNMLGPAGCAQFAFTALTVKSGVKPSGYDIMAWRRDTKDIYDNNGPAALTPEGLFTWDGSWMNTLTNNELVFEAHHPDMTYTEEYLVNEVWKQNKIAMLGTTYNGTHWVAMDYVDSNNRVHIVDSGYEGDMFERYKNHAKGIMIFRSNKSVEELPILGDSSKPVRGSGDKLEDGSTVRRNSEGGIVFSTVTEDALKGMEPRTYADNTQIESTFPGVVLTANYEDLDLNAKENVDSLAKDIELGKTEKWFSKGRAVPVFFGLLLMIYSCVLTMGYALDTAWGSGGTAVKFFTLGRYSISDAHEGSRVHQGTRYLTMVEFIVLVVVLVTLSIVLVSGTLQNWVLTVITELW